MIKLFSQDHEKINNLIEKVDDLNSTSASKAFFLANQAKKLDESFLTTENKLKNSLADSELYMQNRLKKNEKLISDIVEEMNKQTKELNSKLNNIARLNSKNDEMMVKFIETSKEELKNEFTEHFEAEIQILKVETQDMSNFLDRFEKAMKNSLVLVESSMDEHISKQVIELKQEMKTLQNNSDLGNEITANLITQRNEELKESFRNLDQKIKWAMRDIHSEKDKIIGEVMTREREMTEKLDDIVKRALFKVDMIDEIILNEENMRNKLIIDSQLLKQEITDFCAFTRTDLFDINTKTLIQIKEDLLHTLDEELIVIRKKLDWLPMDFSEIKDFNSVEARIYVLETRLRIEETNRMLERENIIHDLEKLKSNSKTQTRTTANRPKCSTPMASRPKTRTNQTVRKTISPGGMCTVEM